LNANLTGPGVAWYTTSNIGNGMNINDIGTKLIDASEAARILSLTRRTIYNLIADDELKAQRVGKRQWLISRASVLEFKRRKADEIDGTNNP
jgi:excisionase family DNA binding protein